MVLQNNNMYNHNIKLKSICLRWKKIIDAKQNLCGSECNFFSAIS